MIGSEIHSALKTTNNHWSRIQASLPTGGLVLIGELRGCGLDSKLWDAKDREGNVLKDDRGEVQKDLVEKFQLLVEYRVPGRMLPQAVIVEWAPKWEGGKKGKCPVLKRPAVGDEEPQDPEAGDVVMVWVESSRAGSKGEIIVKAAHCEVIPDLPVKVVTLSSSAKK